MHWSPYGQYKIFFFCEEITALTTVISQKQHLAIDTHLYSKTPDPEICISLGDTVIKPSDTVDLLGIVIDDKLTFHQHVKKMTSNAALKLNAL